MTPQEIERTPGALRAARVIMYGKEHIETEGGVQTLEGIAEIIDRETGALVMLAVLIDLERRLTENSVAEPLMREACLIFVRRVIWIAEHGRDDKR
jgi:hypothetical protein